MSNSSLLFLTIVAITEVTSREKKKILKPLQVCNDEERERKNILTVISVVAFPTIAAIRDITSRDRKNKAT